MFSCFVLYLVYKVTVEDWDLIFQINVRGVFLCYQYAAKQMVLQGRGGRIIGASSLVSETYMFKLPNNSGRTCRPGNKVKLHSDLVDSSWNATGAPRLSTYSASKFAVRGLTQSAGKACPPTAICVH
jgi:NAD(P)-dependent dehydrogenase (short-subunit alcohol dehydrogenase family)